jgi:PAS domain-containing protein
MALIEPDLRVRDANRSFARLVGRGVDEVRGRALHELGTEWQLESWRNADGRVGEALPDVTSRGAGRRSVILRGTVVQLTDESDRSLILAVADEVE